MRAACPRLFEAEALRDGRLGDPELARFRAHVSMCPECAREVRALEALAQALRDSADSGAAPGIDELHVRRRRTRLLAAFDATLVPAPPQRFGRVALGVATGVFALAALLLAVARWRSPGDAAAGAVVAPDPIAVHAEGNARWSRSVAGQLEEISLRSGTLAIRVDHARAARRLLVLLPDGELEDIGTAFTVSAEPGRSTRVLVHEGRVELRLRGQSPRVLRAGDVWDPASATAVAPPAASTAESTATAPARQPARSPAPSARPRTASPSARDAAPALAAPSSSALVADPAADFRAALAAFNQGDGAGAAARFSAFVAKHPADARAEDAAYLRILALQRAGDASGAERAARDYLRRYPRGFRRSEVEALLR